jgi:hypothetical protein
MTVRVDELTTDVTVESGRDADGGATSAAAGASPHWAQVEQVRAALDRLARDEARTSAEAYGD